MAINVDNNQRALAIPALFRLAFRPLFLGGTLFSVLAIGWWLYFLINPFSWLPHGGPVWWHGHEMLFGFGTAIVTGFLLTAVQSWTGVIGIRGKPLAALALLWLTGRIIIAFNFGLPGWLIALVDVAFLLFVSIAMAYPVIKVKQWQNLMFAPILLLLAIFNAGSHWSILTNQYSLAVHFLHATILSFTLIIAVLGGRVIPAFTVNTIGCVRPVPIKWLERVSIFSILMMIIIAIYGFDKIPPIILFPISSIAAVANGFRFLRWGGQHTGSIPLLWSLHLAYAFIPLGFILLALQSVGLMNNNSAALHSFTVGAIGGMILSMISRVTLGHTGRPLEPHALVAVAYVFILLAAIIRVLIPTLLPEFTSVSITLSGVLWILAYSIYLYFYVPMLITTRADGRPG